MLSGLRFSHPRVALRKESVDRNCIPFALKVRCKVALRKESVDRNNIDAYALYEDVSRSPQGERG